jgi:hypothetical protein
VERGTEIIPGKNPDTRIKPLPLINGHGVEIELWPRKVRYNNYEFVNVMGVKGEGNRSRVDK